MCGILITKNKIKRELIAHRGIISNNVYDGNNELYLIHSLLPFQTDIKNGIQPKPLFDENHTFLLYNGEIFNYPKEYKSDTEYLVSFFKKYNTFDQIISRESLAEINMWDGFWSIVIYNGKENNIICFNDPLGKKQLYYNTIGELSSEIKPLIKSDYSFDRIYFSQIKKWGYNTNQRTPFSEIKRIPNNTICKYNFDGLKHHLIMSYFHDYYNFNMNLESSRDKIKYDIRESINRRLISKTYPISCLVSGGLDSSIIAYHLNNLADNIRYFTIENLDDEKYVNILEKELHIDIERLSIGQYYDLGKILYANETPVDLGSVVPQYMLMNAVKNKNYKLCLTGDGADELFGGYKRMNSYNSQLSDIFDELTYYHLPRLDKLSMNFTIELRSPFLGHEVVKDALGLHYSDLRNKWTLREIYKDMIHPDIVNRNKVALKYKKLREDKMLWRKKLIYDYVSMMQKKVKDLTIPILSGGIFE